jgi:hypothetical protein
MCDGDTRVDGSSSTMRSFTFVWGIVHLLQGITHKSTSKVFHCAQSSHCSILLTIAAFCQIGPDSPDWSPLREKHLRRSAPAIDRARSHRAIEEPDTVIIGAGGQHIGGYFSTGASSYHSLQMSFTRRTKAGLTVYTLAHALDDVISLSNEVNDGYGVVPSQINTLEYGNGDLDIRNRGVLTANYALPFGKTHSWNGGCCRSRMAGQHSAGLGVR